MEVSNNTDDITSGIAEEQEKKRKEAEEKAEKRKAFKEKAAMFH